MSRKETNRLLAMLSEGVVTAEQVVDMCMSAMSEDDVAEMLDNNELSERFFTTVNDDDSDICGDCNGSGEGMYDGSSCSTCGGSGEYTSSEGPDPDWSREMYDHNNPDA